ncbi:MAG: hypothetical protein HONBIEJF_02459 [Fimbriimonadaceae bacterium]|nr:hypothetical protein [Fimbriimonadaceae bacterium]
MGSGSQVNSAWFAGPKAENADWFAEILNKVVWDYYFWRRNYYPQDGAVIGSKDRRHEEEFHDQFEDLLNELLGRLKGDCPFHSPRYAGHMLSEQTLPSIAGYFAAMLYNPNNVTNEVAPVTVELEIEAARLISQMLGHGPEAWAHLCSGGTMANFEALWVARSMLYLPIMVHDARHRLGLPSDSEPRTGQSPQHALAEYAELFRDRQCGEVRAAIAGARGNVAERGFHEVERDCDLRPVILIPETHHYCFNKGLDLLGFGRSSLVRIRVTDEFRMDVADLDSKLREMGQAGRHVAAVVAIIGTTEEGAIDPLDEIVELRSELEAAGKPSFWLHADAAYGGYLRSMILPERIGLGDPRAEVIQNGERRHINIHLPENHACDALEVLGECDSVTVDPHKLGYIPYPAGAISFRDARIKPLVRQVAPYLNEGSTAFDEDIQSHQIGVYSLEGSKPGAVAASVWLSHKSIPLDVTGHGALMRETIRQASTLYSLLLNQPSQSVKAVPLCYPGSNIVCYAFRPLTTTTLARINRLNQDIHERLSLGREMQHNIYAQRFFVSRTTLSPDQYSGCTVAKLLKELGVTEAEFLEEGVFLLRSVLMNPWYEAAKRRGHDVLSGLVSQLFADAERIVSDTVEG